MAVLIGLVTLTGALITWRSVNLSGTASSVDRRAVLDTISQQKAKAAAEAQLSFDLVNFARMRTDMSAAEHLEKLAADAHNTQEPDADALDHDARVYRGQVASFTDTGVVDPTYVTGTTSADLKFDDGRRLRDLERASPYAEAAPVDPAVTVRKANRLHDRSLRLLLFVVGLAGVIVLLTVSQLVEVARLPLAGVGSIVFVLLAAVAFVGDHH